MTALPEIYPEPTRFESYQDVIDAAHLGYINLSYHNYPGHIQETIDAVPVFCAWAGANGITDIPQEALMAVMGYHDFELHIPLSDKRTKSDEAHSALVLGQRLIQFPEGREVYELAIRAILATTPNLVPKSNFDLGARIIDTGNVCSEDPVVALEKTHRVIIEEEIELKSRKTGSFIEKRDKLASFLQTFYYPGLGRVEFVAEDGSPVPYEPADIGYENVRKLGSISRKEFEALIPGAEETFAFLWPEKQVF